MATATAPVIKEVQVGFRFKLNADGSRRYFYPVKRTLMQSDWELVSNKNLPEHLLRMNGQYGYDHLVQYMQCWFQLHGYESFHAATTVDDSGCTVEVFFFQKIVESDPE